MRIAQADLKLDRLWVVHPAPGASYALADGIEAMPLADWKAELLK
jgi:hypothetical protein